MSTAERSDSGEENALKKIIVVGSSGHAVAVIDIIEKEQCYKILGLIDPFKELSTEVFGYRVLGGQNDIPRIVDKIGAVGAIIGVGDNWDRYMIFKEIRQLCPDMKFVSTVHPFSHVGRGVSIGIGSVVMPGAVINSGAQIGRFCIVNTTASIDHDCILGDFASVAPGVTLGGRVEVGKYASVSLGVKIIHKVSIGEHVVVGAGAVVLEDLPDRVVAYGVPARIIRKRNVGEKYF